MRDRPAAKHIQVDIWKLNARPEVCFCSMKPQTSLAGLLNGPREFETSEVHVEGRCSHPIKRIVNWPVRAREWSHGLCPLREKKGERERERERHREKGIDATGWCVLARRWCGIY